MNESNNEFGAFLAGFVIGGLVGAATALILAPQTGEETRARLAAAGGDRMAPIRERAGSSLSDMRGNARNAGSHMQESARIVLSEGRSKVAGVTEQITHLRKANNDGEEPPEAVSE